MRHVENLYLNRYGGRRRRDDSYMLWKVLDFMIWANHSDVRFDARNREVR